MLPSSRLEKVGKASGKNLLSDLFQNTCITLFLFCIVNNDLFKFYSGCKLFFSGVMDLVCFSWYIYPCLEAPEVCISLKLSSAILMNYVCIKTELQGFVFFILTPFFFSYL